MTQVVVAITGGTSWTVPIDCNLIDSVEVVGVGSGATYFSGNGGAYAKSTNIPVTPLARAFCSIGALSNSPTWFNVSSFAAPTLVSQGALAMNGNLPGNIGSLIYLGGLSGGDHVCSCGPTTLGGGGGAAGPNGPGGNGGTTGGGGGGGGGGANGGGNGGNCGIGSFSSNGGAGGSSRSKSGVVSPGGVGSVNSPSSPPGNGTNGSGSGAGSTTGAANLIGGIPSQDFPDGWTDYLGNTYGLGSGSGGGNQSSSITVGYGGGQGYGGQAGPGLIIIKYTPVAPPAGTYVEVISSASVKAWRAPLGLSGSIKIEGIGAGGSGYDISPLSNNYAGGGGAYAVNPAVSLASGQPLFVQLGTNSLDSIASPNIDLTGFYLKAVGGKNSLVGSATTGGLAASCYPLLNAQNGGNGGRNGGTSTAATHGGGGGGAGGPGFDGKIGGTFGLTSSTARGSGGGAAGVSGSLAGVNATSTIAGRGGAGQSGIGGGAASTASSLAGAGAVGLGGGGGGGWITTAYADGGAGSSASTWTFQGSVYGPGGGGGGAGASAATVMGAGGWGGYGGGGGGTQIPSTGGGGGGLIILTYTIAATPATGSLNWTETNDATTATSKLSITGSSSWSETNDTLVAQAVVSDTQDFSGGKAGKNHIVFHDLRSIAAAELRVTESKNKNLHQASTKLLDTTTQRNTETENQDVKLERSVAIDIQKEELNVPLLKQEVANLASDINTKIIEDAARARESDNDERRRIILFLSGCM